MAIEIAEDEGTVSGKATEEQAAALRFLRTDLANQLFDEDSLKLARKRLFNLVRAEQHLFGRLAIETDSASANYLAIRTLTE